MQLETPRLILREFAADDWPAILAYQSDPLYLRYYESTDRTAADVQAFVARQIDHQHRRPRYQYQLVVTLKSTGELIGNCGIRKPAANAMEAELGYELSPKHWGNGYATEAAGRVLAFGFEELGVHRVSSWTVADNSGSMHVLDKLGFRLEGRLREKEFYKGRWWDSMLFAILEDEWRTRQR